MPRAIRRRSGCDESAHIDNSVAREISMQREKSGGLQEAARNTAGRQNEGDHVDLPAIGSKLGLFLVPALSSTCRAAMISANFESRSSPTHRPVVRCAAYHSTTATRNGNCSRSNVSNEGWKLQPEPWPRGVGSLGSRPHVAAQSLPLAPQHEGHEKLVQRGGKWCRDSRGSAVPDNRISHGRRRSHPNSLAACARLASVLHASRSDLCWSKRRKHGFEVKHGWPGLFLAFWGVFGLDLVKQESSTEPVEPGSEPCL